MFCIYIVIIINTRVVR